MLFKTQTFARAWQIVQSKLELLHQKGKLQDHPGVQGQGITKAGLAFGISTGCYHP